MAVGIGKGVGGGGVTVGEAGTMGGTLVGAGKATKVGEGDGKISNAGVPGTKGVGATGGSVGVG